MSKCDKENKDYKPLGTEKWPLGGVSEGVEPSPNDRDYSWPRDKDCR
jgi:hypothetical protein